MMPIMEMVTIIMIIITKLLLLLLLLLQLLLLLKTKINKLYSWKQFQCLATSHFQVDVVVVEKETQVRENNV